MIEKRITPAPTRRKVSMVGGGGGKEIFATAEIHVSLIILKISCTKYFFFKTKVEINIFNSIMPVWLHIPQNGDQDINMYVKFDL